MSELTKKQKEELLSIEFEEFLDFIKRYVNLESDANNQAILDAINFNSFLLNKILKKIK